MPRAASGASSVRNAVAETTSAGITFLKVYIVFGFIAKMLSGIWVPDFESRLSIFDFLLPVTPV